MTQINVYLHHPLKKDATASLLFHDGDPERGMSDNWQDQFKRLEEYVILGCRILRAEKKS